MTDPLALIVLVAAGDASNPTTIAMARATADALGGAPVEVRETPAEPTDAEALAVERQSNADAVVELIWNDVERRHVTVRVHLATSRRWVERSIGFMPSDPPSERGRTLGFAAASILPEGARHPARPDEAAAGPPASGAPPLSPSSPRQSQAEATPSQTVVPPHPEPQARPPGVGDALPPTSASNLPPPPHRPRVEIDLLAVGGVGIGGHATGAGGGGALGWLVTDELYVRMGASERAGRIDVAEATVFTLLLDAGFTWHPWQTTRSRPFGLSFRAAYLVVRQSATHFDADDPEPVTHFRWLSGVEAAAEGSWALSAEVQALVGVGFEDVFASTHVNVRNVEVATLPPLRVVGEAGFRLRF